MKLPRPETETLSRSQKRRRDDIVQAALKIFDRDGFEAAKMTDIAREAEVAKGTLYLYFDTKIELLEAVILTEIMPTLQKMGEVAQSKTGSATDLLARQMRIAARRMASNEMASLLRHMVSGSSQHRRIIKLYYDNVVQSGIEHIKATLDYGVETGEFRQNIKDIDPLVLVGAHIYTAVWKILFADLEELDIEKLVDDHLELVLGGLLAYRQQDPTA
ncbi:TetR/AcrR family transcriptional regulator [uncultured Hoeflea sp.]|uniref:TetR/AcrR family transcriptional regulator n=1 Tax=uncultured Hoeflea sp. TaxID=538666 RepID=UPI0026128D14|nr:TetR/AcrR family transcriptional regulator [uncultured Hoeflea sp.]